MGKHYIFLSKNVPFLILKFPSVTNPNDYWCFFPNELAFHDIHTAKHAFRESVISEKIKKSFIINYTYTKPLNKINKHLDY